MKNKKHIKKTMAITLALLLGVSGILVSSPSLAGGYYHHWHRHYWHDGGRGNAFAGGLLFGAVIGAIASHSADQDQPHYGPPVYYDNCHQVVRVYRQCDYNQWGDEQCYRVRKIRNFC